MANKILPAQICLHNYRYLTATYVDNHYPVRADKTEKDKYCILYPESLGNDIYRFKNKGTGKYLSVIYYQNEDVLWAEKSVPDQYCSFQVIYDVTSSDTICLKSVAKGTFWKRIYYSDTNEPIKLVLTQVSSGAYFKLERPVLSDNIVVDQYLTPNILSQQDVFGSSMVLDNSGSSATLEQNVGFTEQQFSSLTWNATAGVEVGASATVSAGVPVLGSVEFQVSVKLWGSYSWGASNGSLSQISASTTVTVPPGKKVKAFAKYKKVHFTVPFSYTRTIVYIDGTKEVTTSQGVFETTQALDIHVVVQDI